MNWWVIEYGNKQLDSHTFARQLQGELTALLVAAGGGPAGAAVCTNSESSTPDNQVRFYFDRRP